MAGFVQPNLNIITGHPTDPAVMMAIYTQVSQLAREFSAFYIGKTSGVSGLQERFNNKYRALGYDKIVPIYETLIADHANQVENAVILYAQQNFDDMMENQRIGSSGPLGYDDPKIVYIALKF